MATSLFELKLSVRLSLMAGSDAILIADSVLGDGGHTGLDVLSDAAIVLGTTSCMSVAALKGP